MANCKDLIENLEYTCIKGSVDTEVAKVEMDSRKITPGCMFICIAGANFDGHSKAAEAAEKKAAVLVAPSATMFLQRSLSRERVVCRA